MPRDPVISATGLSPSPHPARRRIEALHARVRRIEGGGLSADATAAAPIGIAEIDTHLPAGGLARGALHELIPQNPGDSGAATGFCAALLARLLEHRDGTRAEERSRAVLWCQQDRATDAGEIYPPGLARLRMDASRLLAVRTRRDADTLWAMEEGLRCSGLAAVVGEVRTADLTASRRLQLAAEASGVTALLLRPATGAPGPSAAATRWRIAAAPSQPRGWLADLDEPGAACWRTILFRCRGGAPGSWMMEWRDETGDLALAAPVRDRPDKPCNTGLTG